MGLGASLDTSARLWQAGLAATALAVGLLAGIEPVAAIVAALGLAFVLVLIADVAVGLCLFVVLAFLEVLPALGTAVSFIKLAGLALALSWLATVSNRDGRGRDLLTDHPSFSFVLAAFVTWAGLSVVWAESTGDSVVSAFRWGLSLFLFVIVYTAVREPRHAIWVVATFVTGAVLAAAYGILVPPEADASGRLTGTIGDANELAAVLVAGVVLSIALVGMAVRSPVLRVTAVVAGAVCAAGLVLTLSRTGLVGLGFAILAGMCIGGRWRPTLVMLGVLAVLGVTAYFAAFAPEEARERVTRLDGGTGRTDIWKVGWRMVEDKPIIGVGTGNFAISSIHYLLEPGAIERDEFIVDDAKVAHNVYLQVLAELGVVGLLMFLAVLAFALRSAAQAAARFNASGNVQMEILARAVFVAIVTLLAANFFLSDQFSKQLWLLLGLGPALLAIASSARPEPDDVRPERALMLR